MYQLADAALQPVFDGLVAKLNQRNVSVVGLGRTAFARSGLYPLIKDFRVLCIKESQDLQAIREKFPVFTVERDFSNYSVERQNTSSLLRVSAVADHINQIDPPVCLFVYKSSPKIQAAIEDWPVELLASESEVRKFFEFKWEFRQIALDNNIPLIPGEQWSLDELEKTLLSDLQERLGDDLVFQLTDYTTGGGKGTFAISSEADFVHFWEFARQQQLGGKTLERVNITQFIEGESASIAGCVTQYGTFSGDLQRQLIDLPEVVEIGERFGVFAGHEWGDFYDQNLQDQARALVTQLGQVMASRGFRGVFGIDVIVDRKHNKVWLVECNSRYTGAFPMYSMLQREVGEIPLDLWHFLEHYHMTYEVDFESIQASYHQPKQGAQLILHNLEGDVARVDSEIKAGVYLFDRERLTYQRPGFDIADIKADNECILTDGVPLKGEIVKPGNRIGRLLFKNQITQNQGSQLRPEISQLVQKIYKLYHLSVFAP